MPTWSDILNELKSELEKGNAAAGDTVRRKYLAELAQYTHRNTILYATKWTQPAPDVPPEFVSITDEDTQGFMEVVYGLKGNSLDLIVHSPGGSAEATEAIVSYLRSKFSDIRVIIPQAAMSAATMLACSADRIVMGKQSSIGPIDPQMIVVTQLGPKATPAQAILDQFDEAKRQCKDPKLLGAWVPILPQYGPALLVECQDALALSKQLVERWLTKYMFKGKRSPAAKVAKVLSDHTYFKTHARHINRDEARAFGLTGIDDLESDQKFQDLVLSVFHATMHSFNMSALVKIIENNNGRSFLKAFQVIVASPFIPGQPVQTPTGLTPPPMQPQSAPAAPGSDPSNSP